MKHSHISLGLPASVAEYTASALDAVVAFAYLLVATVVTVEGTAPWSRLVVLPLVVFLPGYAVVSALFPRTTPAGDAEPFEGAVEGALAPAERAVLSFGTSIALLPPLGVTLSVTDLGYEATTLLATLGSVVVGGLCLAVARRLLTPRPDRVAFSPRSRLRSARATVSGPTWLDTALAVALVVAVVVATGGLSAALVAPADGESYTTLKLLTENESGALVTDGYPDEIAANESRSLVVGVENHEDEQTTYTLVSKLQAVDRSDGDVTVLEERELGRDTRTVAAGETWYDNWTVTPSLTGDDLRLVFLLYRGAPPETARTDSAYRYVHLSVSVTGG